MNPPPFPYRPDPAGPISRPAAPSRGGLRRGSAASLLALLAACGGDGSGGGPGGPGGPGEPSPVRETCAAVVRLGVGESAELAADPQGRVLCRVDGGGGTEFAVAFADTRAASKAAAGPEGYGDAFEAFRVAVATGGQVPVISTTRSAPSRATRPDDLVRTEMAAAAPANAAPTRGTPWAEGERFPLYDAGTGTSRTARVLRVYDGGFVAAWFEGDNEAGLPRFLAQLDSAWTMIDAHALPLLRRAYSPEADPRTSPGSGQFLVILRAAGRGDAWGWTSADRSFGGGPRLWTDVKVRDYPGAMRLAELMAHEIGHAYQAMYMYRTRPAGTEESYAGATFWGVEGGADLVSFELVRRAAGVGLTANFDGAGAAGGARQRMRQWAHPGTGTLTDGYASAAGFLRAQAARLALAGAGEDDAVAEVLRGASDGWFGYDHLGGRREGLAARMRARIPAWSPEAALLDWALAHAADDRTAEARWQDPTYLRVRETTGTDFAWRPMATLDGAGGAGETTRGYGSPHYLLLSGAGEMRFGASANAGGLRWRIVRVR